MTEDVWVFGYGSLVWRPGFAFVERRRAIAIGWARRFWQKSTDHRGTAEAPGRVATMVPLAGARTVGAAFRVAGASAPSIIAELDVREQQGYERIALEIELDGGAVVRAMTYVAPRDNPYFVEEPVAAIAAIVAVAHGPSGANLDYAQKLAAALAELDAHDEHVEEIVALAQRAP